MNGIIDGFVNPASERESEQKPYYSTTIKSHVKYYGPPPAVIVHLKQKVSIYPFKWSYFAVIEYGSTLIWILSVDDRDVRQPCSINSQLETGQLVVSELSKIVR